ncbi:carbonic anhydrase 4-like [Scleropages formosus]|uniref:Carbonic anhydrase n=1 Tax=Scleropages formosus TaxID=113540 RepID=A0A0N8JYP2_SCLFO|nr:carbonic anhydrase 4-like [Scleropages formosus]
MVFFYLVPFYFLSDDTVWASLPIGYCNGTRQSPVNIVTASVQPNANLTAFNFTGFSSNSTMSEITNTGETVQVKLQTGSVNISGGGLSTTYNALQFHLHWGNGSNVPGSEHTVDSKRYPMELHMVTVKPQYNGSITLAVSDPEGVAAFSFFIEGKNDSNLPASWNTLTSYLSNITQAGQKANISSGISLDDLLVGVNRTQYYRYLGSLTVPDCNEAVVWTVFKDSIKIDLFSASVYFNTSPPLLMTNTYRSSQKLNSRVITSQVSTTAVTVTPTTAKPSSSPPSSAALTLPLLCAILLFHLFPK